jgi:splicing factor 3A subunit 3
LAYVQVFSDASRIPIETRKTTEYKAYIHDLRSYLESFIVRSKPLFNIEEALHKIQNQFEKKWQRKQFPDWFLKNTGPLFCEACQKEFKNEAVFEAHKTGKKHLKAVENMNQQNNPIEKFKDIVLVEFSIHEFKKILNVIVDDTLAHIERKQTLTDRERVFLFLNF